MKVKTLTVTPQCHFCLANYGERVDAEFLAAQAVDAGEDPDKIEWFPICRTHADGWNEGGDWQAPMYPLRAAGLVTALNAKAAGYLDRCDRSEARDQRLRFEHVAEAYRDAAIMVETAMAPIFDVPANESNRPTSHNRVHFKHSIEQNVESPRHKTYTFVSTGRHEGSYTREVRGFTSLEAARNELRRDFPNAVF